MPKRKLFNRKPRTAASKEEPKEIVAFREHQRVVRTIDSFGTYLKQHPDEIRFIREELKAMAEKRDLPPEVAMSIVESALKYVKRRKSP